MNKILQSMRQDGTWRPILGTAMAVTLIAFSSPGFAAKGGIPGPPVGGETANNLSTPAIQTESANTILANWAVPNPAVRGVHFSYGCDIPEVNDPFSYPNTSCVDNLDEPTIYYDAQQCTAAGMPCEGLPVSRIYWQKVDVNEWWADDDGIFGQVPDSEEVAYIDWGDALEAVSWTERSVIRVETQPWGNHIPGFDPTLGATCETSTGDPESDCKTGFQMWHVSGQGITEHWGVRASDEDPAQPFAYESPFQIIKTTEARLNLTKMAAGDALCSQPGGNPGDEPPAVGAWIVDLDGKGHWDGTCTWSDAPYTVETSVGGKYVYGFNWRMKNVDLSTMCPGWVKTGFWRLTFYAPDDVMFTDALIPTVAPPAVPAVDPSAEAAAFAAVVMSSDDDSEEDDRLYIPNVDAVNNLTHLDICIVAKTQGGGGGKGGGGKGGGKGGGAGGGKGGGKKQ